MSVKISFNNGSSVYSLEHWFVGEGVAVNSGQDLAMIRADGVNIVLTAPINGIFLAKRVLEGESFNPESTIGLIVTHEEAGDIKVTDKLTIHDRRILDSLHNIDKLSSAIPQPIHVKATPRARREAREKNIDIRSVPGSGPDGRIQHQDVVEYCKNRDKKSEVTEIDFKPVYNLPQTPLAQNLIREHGLDASLIPAAPGSKRLRKKDVERYLKDPQGAVEQLKREAENGLYLDLEGELDQGYREPVLEESVITESVEKAKKPENIGTEQVIEEPEEEAQETEITESETEQVVEAPEKSGMEKPVEKVQEPETIKPEIELTEAPEESAEIVQESETEEVIEAQEPEIEEPEEEAQEPETTEPELEESAEITEVEPEIEEPEIVEEQETETDAIADDNVYELPEDTVLELEGTEEPKLIEEGEYEPDVIRLSTEEPASIPSDETIELGTTTPETSEPETFVRSSHLMRFTTVDLKKLGLNRKKSNESLLEFANKVFLRAITKALRESGIEDIGYLGSVEDIEENRVSRIENVDGDLKIGNGKTNFIVANLLSTNLTDVSGLIDTDMPVLYYSYICQFSDFLGGSYATRSLLSLSLDFNEEVLSISEAIKILDNVREGLSSIDEVSR